MGLGPSKSQQPISVTDSAPSPIASRHLTLSFQSHAIWQKIRRGFIDVLEAFVEPQGWRNRPPPFKSVCSTNYAQMYVDLQGNKRPLTFESHNRGESGNFHGTCNPINES